MGSFLMETLAPSLGVVLALAMFSSPVTAVLQVMKHEHLGELNPLPCLLVMANCAGWIGYSLTNGDLYVFFANGPGFLVGVFLVFGTYAYASKRQREIILYLFLFFSTVLITASISGVKALQAGRIDVKGLQQLWGLTANFNLLCYYASPLSTLYSVVTTRNSASIYLPLAVCALLNSSLWVVYGSAKGDLYIAVPNAVGWVFSIIQIVLRIAMPPAYEVLSPDSVSDRDVATSDPEEGSAGMGGDRKRLLDGRNTAASSAAADV